MNCFDARQESDCGDMTGVIGIDDTGSRFDVIPLIFAGAGILLPEESGARMGEALMGLESLLGGAGMSSSMAGKYQQPLGLVQGSPHF